MTGLSGDRSLAGAQNRMPDAAGTALGPGVLFWLMGAAVGGGSWVAVGLRKVFAAGPAA